MNRLPGSLSPYLLQHADNPVHWHPWGREALELAAAQDRPILLSIGYAACHWCHVMAHESFEDEETARLMNEHFVNIKLDREERPDIDQIYQVAHQLMQRRGGGWPLTVFMTPEQVPFFIGTYFPSESRPGMMDFRQILAAMAETWRTRRDDVRLQNSNLLEAMRGLQNQDAGGAPLDERLVLGGLRDTVGSLDPVKGGFRGAPKFPHPVALEFCVSRAISRGEHSLPDAVGKTLKAIARGGLCDHVGGGFFRYCVDEDWEVPHFEKMLYDNGQLLSLFALAYEGTGEGEYLAAATHTAEWILSEMRDPSGRLYCSLDADSEGEEGKFYAWDPDEIRATLDDREFEIARAVYGLDRAPNFEGRHHLSFRLRDPGSGADGIGPEEIRAALPGIRRKLLERRGSRPRPGCDDKTLVSWTALAAKGLLRAGRVAGHESWAQGGLRALEFIGREMWDGRMLRAAHRDGQSYLDGYLDDHAFVLDALLEAEAGPGLPDSLKGMPQGVATALVDLFEDRERGGFHFTGKDHEQLLVRLRSSMDDVMPSGNAVAASALWRLGTATGDARLTKASQDCLAAFSRNMAEYPQSSSAMLMALAGQHPEWKG